MATIFYVSEKNRGEGYTQINFFKTEKEALRYGISKWSDFDMFSDPDSKEDSYEVQSTGVEVPPFSLIVSKKVCMGF